MKTGLSLVVVLLIVTACHPKTYHSGPISGPAYRYVQISRDEYVIVAMTDEGAKAAQKAIGCGQCAIEYNGKVWTVKVYARYSK